MDFGETFAQLVQGGLGSVAAYLAAHVLLCLLPAFLIAGAMAALIPKATVTRFLGRNAPRSVAYGGAALAGSLLAVCSCTILPLFAGIYRKGAGIGPAFTFLFFAPAANILALAYTGSVLGADLAFARLGLSLLFGIGIGALMAMLYRHEDAERDLASDAFAGPDGRLDRRVAIFLGLLVLLLLVGTLKVPILEQRYLNAELSLRWPARVESLLAQAVPADPTIGREGVSFQGALLIGLLAAIAFSAYRGIEAASDVINRWTKTAAALLGLTLLAAAVRLDPRPSGLSLAVTGRMIGVAVVFAGVGLATWRQLARSQVAEWLWESWRFVRQILPLLLVGVFLVGVLREIVRPEWIEKLAGRNSLTANLAGVAFGVFMYFPTLVEVPIAHMFLGLGMHRGPLLAYLMADPELSLQSILALTVIVGRRKAWTYVMWVAIFSTMAGFLYGSWVDGAAAARLVTWLLAGLLAVGGVLYALTRRHRPQTAVGSAESQQVLGA